MSRQYLPKTHTPPPPGHKLHGREIKLISHKSRRTRRRIRANTQISGQLSKAWPFFLRPRSSDWTGGSSYSSGSQGSSSRHRHHSTDGDIKLMNKSIHTLHSSKTRAGYTQKLHHTPQRGNVDLETLRRTAGLFTLIPPYDEGAVPSDWHAVTKQTDSVERDTSAQEISPACQWCRSTHSVNTLRSSPARTVDTRRHSRTE